jgi:type VI secretion system protein ImpC
VADPPHPAAFDRGRRPRVQISYDVEVDGSLRRVELPFVIGVLADLSGHPASHPLPMRERKFVRINRRNFDAVLTGYGPRLAFRAPNRLTDDGSLLDVELAIGCMADFEPAGVVAQLPALQHLLDVRRRLTQVLMRAECDDELSGVLSAVLAGGHPPDPLPESLASGLARENLELFIAHAANPEQVVSSDVGRTTKYWIAQIDSKLAAQVNEIIHHPDFQRLEAAWRGLAYLVAAADIDESLKVKVLSVTKHELLKDLEKAAEFDQGTLFKKVYEEEYGQLGGEPYGLLVGDYEFSRTPDDVALLRWLSHVAAAAHAPFVAAAAPQMFNMERFTELTNPRDLHRIFGGAEYAAWKSFRESEDARYVALTLPHVLARLPYGADFPRPPAFIFEEGVDGPDRDKYLWMSAAWAYAGQAAAAFAADGWFMRTRGAEGGGKVDGLPIHPFPTDEGNAAIKAPTEVAVSDRREFDLSNLGFLPLMQGRNREFALFMGAQSTQKPKEYTDPAATASAELSAKFNYLLSVSRFAHYLKVMARDAAGAGVEAGDLQRRLHDWIMEYVVGNPESASNEVKAQKPLAGADVQVRGVKGKPGWYEAVAYLRPHYQVETVTTAMRLVAEIPKGA